jgi:TRAP-type C4-dicarboxylate transport system substrate-binding protein
VFKNMQHAQKTVQDRAFSEHFLPMLEAKGMFGASIFVYNETSFASKKPIRTLDDFKGTKVRVIASDAERGMMASVGATGVPISLGELTPALQTGVVDVVRSGVSIFNIFKFYTIVKYLTLTRDTPVLTVSYISKIWLDKLPAELRTAVIETTRDAAKLTEPFVFKFVGDAVDAWKANGGEVVTLSPADQAELIRRAREVSDKVFGADPNLAPTYKLLLATAAKYE